jgi:hypothetical protein
VMADVAAGAEVVGSPAQPRRAFFREVAVLRRMARGGGAKDAGDGDAGDGDAAGKDVTGEGGASKGTDTD